MAYKVLVCDKMDPKAVEEIKNLGFDVTVKTGMSPEELGETIPAYHAIIVRSATKVRQPQIDKASSLKVIIRGGVGLDNIDVDYAKSKGIEVRNTPGAASSSVAELALGHIFSCSRFIYASNVTMREGKWLKKEYTGHEIKGKLLGIVGLGRIGKELANRALALGMVVKAYDPYIEAPGISGVEMVSSLDDLLATADIISLHIPKTQEGYLIGKKEFKKMKDGAILINCARGGIVDEDALVDALDEGKLYAAAIDVFEEEPTKNQRILSHPKISLTPHLGATTFEAQARVGKEVVNILKEFFAM